MIKKSVYFGNPAYLSLRLKQLVIKLPDAKGDMPDFGLEDAFTQIKTIPVEDIGVVVLDHPQITITQGLMAALLQNNCAIITCGPKHLPDGLLLPLCGNSVQNERFRSQIEASLPLRKQLLQQTVSQKISNQAAVLQYVIGIDHGNMLAWAGKVRSGDPDNLEARAAAYYWKNLFPGQNDFTRGREDGGANTLLNYGYAILRAVVARALVGRGLLPTLGIHHHNRYNAYCLADDIMEPYRPYVDKLVFDLLKQRYDENLDKGAKTALLSIPTLEVRMNDERRPLMVAASHTTASLVKCFEGEIRKIIYPCMKS